MDGVRKIEADELLKAAWGRRTYVLTSSFIADGMPVKEVGPYVEIGYNELLELIEHASEGAENVLFRVRSDDVGLWIGLVDEDFGDE